jgi:hypothetical protein
MLAELMTEIRAGGTLETSKLAKKLNTTSAMIEAMMDHLRRIGFLKVYETCADACSGCSLTQMCDPKNKKTTAQIWQYEQSQERQTINAKNQS